MDNYRLLTSDEIVISGDEVFKRGFGWVLCDKFDMVGYKYDSSLIPIRRKIIDTVENKDYTTCLKIVKEYYKFQTYGSTRRVSALVAYCEERATEVL